MTVRIAKKHTKAIAEMINTMECAQMFVDKYRDATSNDDLMRFFLWKYEYCRTVITLADEYGIVLPTLETSRINVGTAYDQYKHYRELVAAQEAREAEELAALEDGETIPMIYCKVIKATDHYFVVSQYGKQLFDSSNGAKALVYARGYDNAEGIGPKDLSVAAQEKAA